MSHQLKISALILAGGKASRMEFVEKGLQLYRGEPLISRSLELAQKVGAEVWISCQNPAAYQRYKLPTLNDHPYPSEGPLCAIAAGLNKIDCDYLWVFACDTPSLPNNLWSLFENAMKQEEADIYCIENNGRLQNLSALISKSLAKVSKSALGL